MWQKKLEEKIKQYLDGYNASHDFYHSERVRNNAMEIAKNIDCDKEILEAAALLHDTGYKNHEDDAKRHYLFSMELAKKWLPEVEFPKEKFNDVLEVIRLHDNFHWEKNGEKTDHIETMMIQDADRIEVVGAIGIVRLAYYFGEKGFPIYSNIPVPNSKEVFLNHSLLDQYKRGGLGTWEHLNFPISKKIFKKRADFLEMFYKELKKELEFYHKR